MVELSVQDGKLHCEVLGMHKLWACKSSLDIPLEHIKGVQVRTEDTRRWWHGWKMMGTDLPGLFASGIFRVGGKWVFWDVANPDQAIEIDLVDDAYSELLIEVEDPEAATQMIRSLIGR